jgi:eukaryotic-like serine/threonine-protein kinase
MGISPGVRLETYEIVASIASGGMGEVWLARDLRVDRKVAITILPTDVTRDETRVARFRHEARAASALNLPNVCTISTLGEADDARVFIAMEYIDGSPLRQRLSAGPLPIRRLEAVQCGAKARRQRGQLRPAAQGQRGRRPDVRQVPFRRRYG